MTNAYEAKNVQVLKGLEGVRKRPGMYIGDVGKAGLHHLVWEIVDNSIDEAMAGYATTVKIKIFKDGYIEIADDGRGIPTDIHPQTGVSTVETVLTVLHAGGKFDSNTYTVSGGLHGVGASVVNALSSHLEVWVKRGGKVFFQEFKNGGIPVDKLKIIDETNLEDTGTRIRFTPDFSIMEKKDFEFNVIADRAKQIAYLNKGLRIIVADERIEKSFEYYSEGGLVEYINELSRGRESISKEVVYAEGVHKGERGNIKVEIALQYTNSYTSSVLSYANNISTKEGGTHEQGTMDALLRILNNYADTYKMFKNEKEKLSKDDIKDGLIAIISIKHTDPIFEGQTKGKLGNKDARMACNKIISEKLERFLLENPVDAKAIVQRALLSQKARFAGAAARDAIRRKTIFDVGSLPGKLADCSTKNAEISELYIVEGNSAGGSAKMGRDREYQAILPLKGKVINAEKSRIDKVFQNDEIGSLITALGTGVSEEFNINKLRYHKVVIMTDADVDGAHIRTLLLTFFYRYLKPLIEYGFIYIAQSPLYKISYAKKEAYAYNDQQKDVILKNLPKETKYTIQRYKGLGEMDPQQLWETTMDPEKRKMLQVQIQDAANADLVFSTLMGEDVLPRKEFIEQNAKYAKDIDF